MVLVVYDFGYVARMTRASMAEVMTSQYIRSAVLKGLPYRQVIIKPDLVTSKDFDIQNTLGIQLFQTEKRAFRS